MARATEVMAEGGGSQATSLLACPACGANVKADEQLCPYCGSALSSYTPTAHVGMGAPAAGDGSEGLEESFEGDERGPDDEGPHGRRVLAILGYSLAGLAALAAGVVVAIWVAPRPHHAPPTPVAGPSPVAQPSVAATAAPQPMLALATTAPLQVEVSGVSSRDVDAATAQAQAVFRSGKDSLLNKYKQLSGGGPTPDDGLWVELEITANGEVSAVSILTSTAHNPEVDAEVAKQMLKWTFPTTGPVPTTARYPIVIASGPTQLEATEKQLAERVASYSPTTLAEYRMAKVAATPSIAMMATPAPAAVPTPPVAAASPQATAAPPVAPAVAPSVAPPPPAAPTPETARLETPRPVPAAPPAPPPPSLRERVTQALARDGRFAEVHAEVNGSDVTLFGKVMSDADKAAAERAAWRVAGVNRVLNRILTVRPLLTRVKDVLASDRRFRRVNAYTNGSVVTLFGKVVNEKDKAAAAQLVSGVSGVTGVVNNLTADTEEWRLTQQRINDSLASAGLTSVTVQVIGRLAYLNGQVSSEQDKQRAVNITESTAPVKVEMNMIRVVPKGIF